MAFIEKGNDGVFNGTTPVDVAPAPAAATRRIVRNVVVHNPDTVAAVVTLRIDNAGAKRNLPKVTLQPGESAVYADVIVLDTTGKKVEGVLDAAHTTTAPSFVAAYADVT